MSEAQLRAEIVACEACKCRPCAIRRHDAQEQLAFLASQSKPEPTEDLSGFDPVLLAVGIRMPKAKQKRLLEPAAKAAARKNLSRLRKFERTTEGIARQQGYFDRFQGIRGTVVRG
jgi:hypothetical protein